MRLIQLLKEKATRKYFSGEPTWLCNICGAANFSPIETMDRESGACCRCRSNMRFRSLMAVLTERVFGSVQILAKTVPNAKIVGLGMSDAPNYAKLLAKKFRYTNTHYHRKPALDITKPAPRLLGINDFVVTSDVFEHVPPPIQPSFDNLYALLKPGGVLIFSVPFTLEAATREHYPNLHDFKLVQVAGGDWILRNVTQEGVSEEFPDLIFHGGKGSTLELRVFCRAALERHLTDAGFTDLRVHDEPHDEYGILWLHPFSLVISARRPN